MIALQAWNMWNAGGQFDNGYYFLIRSPLESIKESASIS